MHEIHTLKNGLRIVNRTIPQAGSVAIAVFVGAGGRYEDFDTNYGVTHFLEHLLFKGTKKWPSPKRIPEEIDGVGGYINAYTTADLTAFYVKLPRASWQFGVEVLAELVLRPLMPLTEIDKERSVVTEEMNVYRDDPARFVYDLTGDLLWPTDKLRTNVMGTEQIVNSISRNKILDYYRSHYVLPNMVVSVAGNLEEWEIIDKITEQFTSSRHKIVPSYDPTRGRVSKKVSNMLVHDTNQSHFVVTSRGPAMDTDDEMPMKVLASILGAGFSSRLFMNVREAKGLAYTVYASVSTYTDSGSFEVYAGVNTAKFASALRAVSFELARIRTHAVPDKELNKTKQLLKGRLEMSQEDTGNIVDRLGSHVLLHGSVLTVADTIERIDRVSPSDLLRVAKKYLKPADLRMAFIGPHTERDQAKFETIITS